MLKKKKEEVLYERATGAKVWVKRTPPEERKKQLKENSEKRISTLDDVYIRGRIKSSVHYKGEEITEEMIQAKRKEIIIIRKNKKEGIRAPHASKQLTDGYMRALISLRLKIPKDQITFKQIIEAREQLEEKRRLREL
jgi:hypothetical protein